MGAAAPSIGNYVVALSVSGPRGSVVDSETGSLVGDFLAEDSGELANGQSLFSVNFEVTNFQLDDQIHVLISTVSNDSFIAQATLPGEAIQQIGFTVRNGVIAAVPEPSS